MKMAIKTYEWALPPNYTFNSMYEFHIRQIDFVVYNQHIKHINVVGLIILSTGFPFPFSIYLN